MNTLFIILAACVIVPFLVCLAAAVSGCAFVRWLGRKIFNLGGRGAAQGHLREYERDQIRPPNKHSVVATGASVSLIFFITLAAFIGAAGSARAETFTLLGGLGGGACAASPLLAQASPPADDGVLKPAAAVVIGVVALFYGFWVHANKVRRGIVEDVKTAVKAEIATTTQTPTVNIANQPIAFEMEKEYVRRPDFHKHAELNRQAHDQIKKEFTELVTKIAENLHNLSREVSDLNGRGEVRGEQLDRVERKLDDMKERRARG